MGQGHIRALVPLWGGPRPAPYTSYVHNTRKSGRDGAYSSSRERALVQGSVLSHPIPMLGQGSAASLPVHLICSPLSGFPATRAWLHGWWGEAGPAAGQGRRSPF